VERDVYARQPHKIKDCVDGSVGVGQQLVVVNNQKLILREVHVHAFDLKYTPHNTKRGQDNALM
jgi:hypothetical protein